MRLPITLALLTLTGVALAAEAPKPAEEVFKNIQALKGTPANQLFPAMQFISASLGVECSFCHVEGKMDSDDKKEKQTARAMIGMTLAINKNSFAGHREVTCYSCHHGAEHPAGTPPVLESDAAEHKEDKPAPPPSEPVTAEKIVEKYVSALGGADAIRKVTSRFETGSILSGGRETPIELWTKAPNKRMSIMHMPNSDSITAFDGASGWLAATGRPPRAMPPAEADAAHLDAEFYLALNLKTVFQQLRVGRPETIAGAACNTLIGIRPDFPPVRLWFDQNSGLLVRMARYTESAVGRNPTQIDYADYREVDGVRIPFRWTLARTNGRFTIQIKEVKQNVPIEDGKFAQPETGAKPPKGGS